jgi:hypothetical protein
MREPTVHCCAFGMATKRPSYIFVVVVCPGPVTMYVATTTMMSYKVMPEMSV